MLSYEVFTAKSEERQRWDREMEGERDRERGRKRERGREGGREGGRERGAENVVVLKTLSVDSNILIQHILFFFHELVLPLSLPPSLPLYPTLSLC